MPALLRRAAGNTPVLVPGRATKGTPRGAGGGKGRVRQTAAVCDRGLQRTHHEAVDDEVVVAEPPEIDIFDDRGVCRFGQLQASCEGREHPEDGEVEHLHTRSVRGSTLQLMHRDVAGPTGRSGSRERTHANQNSTFKLSCNRRLCDRMSRRKDLQSYAACCAGDLARSMFRHPCNGLVRGREQGLL